jgi:hypothetical protein
MSLKKFGILSGDSDDCRAKSWPTQCVSCWNGTDPTAG